MAKQIKADNSGNAMVQVIETAIKIPGVKNSLI